MLRLNSENEITIIDGTTLCKAKKLEVADSASLFNLDKMFLIERFFILLSKESISVETVTIFSKGFLSEKLWAYFCEFYCRGNLRTNSLPQRTTDLPAYKNFYKAFI